MGLSVVIIGESVRWLASYKAGGGKIERGKMAEIWNRNGGKGKEIKEINIRSRTKNVL